MASKSFIRWTLLALLYNTSVFVQGHSWVEQLNVIAANGTLISPPGFPRGNVKRSSPTFSDPQMVFLIPPGGGVAEITPTQLMCKDSQTSQTQTDGSPRLQAAPGASIALRYQENGHVTLPQNQPGKPANRGTNFVYYTTQSKPDDKFLGIHRVWNAAGTGGDGRGQLLSTRDFDDGQCYQINGNQISQARQQEFPHETDPLQGADLWCQQDIQLPADAEPGSTVTIYWVWDWPTMPGTAGFPNGKQEIYTTCMDIDIVAKQSLANKVVSQGFVKQDLARAAVSAQFSDIANPTAVVSPEGIPFANAAVATSASSPSLLSPSASSTQLPGMTSSSAVTTKSPCPHSATPTEKSKDTVTLTVTVTATVAVTTTSRPVVTVTENDMVTVVMTNTIFEKRQQASATSISPICSKTASAYRLRARIPFYMVHGTSADRGC